MSTSNYNVDYAAAAADTCSPLTPYILHSLHTLYNTYNNTTNNTTNNNTNNTTNNNRDCSELLAEFQLRNSRTIANRKGNNGNNATTNNATTNNIATNGSNLQAYMKVSEQEKGYRTFILFYTIQ